MARSISNNRVNSVDSKAETESVTKSKNRKGNKMIVVVIVSGIVIGWVVGNYLLDRYINNTNEEINDTQKPTK
jgi:F0F1-type ATP synthase assembly protein I